MGRIGSPLLDANDVFPELNLQLVSGKRLNSLRESEKVTVWFCSIVVTGDLFAISS